MNPQIQQLFNGLVEIHAKGGQDRPQAFYDGFKYLLNHVVTEGGGTMDDENLVDEVYQELITLLNEKAKLRREVLLAQAA